ncbi:MAG: sulfotransferase [Methylococcaceae bacterium]|nr:sulfotransferase [Methylococcaceae bacterium]
MNNTDALAGWLPFFLSAHDGQRQVEWGYMGRERFTEPFFLDTLQILLRRPFNQLFRRQSGLDLLLARAQSHPGLPLKGMIFHMSRCGSTLLTQWLTALPDSAVLSEPEPLDTLLQWPTPHSDTETIQALLAALGQPRRKSDRRLFLKTDCWHMAHIDRLLAAFPDTPWIFLYRNPVEVLVSHQRMPGWHMVPGTMAGHGLHPPDELWNNPQGNGAWILSAILDQAKQAMQRHRNGLLLNYSELPEALEHKLSIHFGLTLSTQDAETLHAVLGRNSKHRHAEFKADAAEKRAVADTQILELAERWLDKPYRLLEQLRIGNATDLSNRP